MEKSNTSSSIESTQEFFDFWLNTYRCTLGMLAKMPALGPAFESAQEFFDSWLNTYQCTLGMLAKMPALGPEREKFEKQMKGFSDFANLYTAWMESEILLMEAMRKVR